MGLSFATPVGVRQESNPMLALELPDGGKNRGGAEA
jgi:hypothetical protein